MTENSRLRVANSGPRAYAPDFATNAAIGRWLRCVANPDPLKPLDVQWQDLVVPPPAPLVDLSNANYVDRQTAVPVLDQDGNIEAPFATFAAAGAKIVGVVVPQAIVATNYDYSAEALLNLPAVDVAIVSEAPQSAGLTNNLVLPDINALGTLTLQVLSVTNATSGGDMKLFDVNSGGLLTCGGFLQAQNCPRISDVHALAFEGVKCEVVGVLTLAGAVARFRDCTFPVFTNIIFAAPGGQVFMDGLSYEQWVTSGSTITNGTIVFDEAIPRLLVNLDGQGFAISNFHNGASAADLALPINGMTPFPDVAVTGLAINSTYQVTYGFRCGWYVDATPAVNGEADFQIGASITTDALGVATVAFNTPPAPNLGLLPPGLGGATFTVAPTGAPGGFTVSTQRPPGVACHSWFEFWLQRYRKVA